MYTCSHAHMQSCTHTVMHACSRAHSQSCTRPCTFQSILSFAKGGIVFPASVATIPWNNTTKVDCEWNGWFWARRCVLFCLLRFPCKLPFVCKCMYAFRAAFLLTLTIAILYARTHVLPTQGTLERIWLIYAEKRPWVLSAPPGAEFST